MVFALADRMKRTVAEVEEMSVDEFNEWVAYMKIRAEWIDADC